MSHEYLESSQGSEFKLHRSKQSFLSSVRKILAVIRIDMERNLANSYVELIF